MLISFITIYIIPYLLLFIKRSFSFIFKSGLGTRTILPLRVICVHYPRGHHTINPARRNWKVNVVFVA